MSEFLEKAVERLDKGLATVTGQKESAMKQAVRDTLADFCRQDKEFAQAVAQGGSFADCMKAVAQGVGSSISDLEAYRKAVQFYFPGAEIRMEMTIDLIGAAAGKAEYEPKHAAAGKAGSILLDLSDFL